MYPITNKVRSFHGSQFENGCQRLGNPGSESKQHTTENKMESAMLVAFRQTTMNIIPSWRYAPNSDAESNYLRIDTQGTGQPLLYYYTTRNTLASTRDGDGGAAVVPRACRGPVGLCHCQLKSSQVYT